MKPEEALDLVRKSIAKSLPDMAEAKGTVRTTTFTLPAPSLAKMAKVIGGEYRPPRQVHAVHLRKTVKAADGTPLLRLVHARVDDDGNILKITTSR